MDHCDLRGPSSSLSPCSCWHSWHSLGSGAKGYIIGTGRPIKVTSETAAGLSIDLFITINFLSYYAIALSQKELIDVVGSCNPLCKTFSPFYNFL